MHWIQAYRDYTKRISSDTRNQFGRLEGPLHIIPGTSNWNTTKDWRTEQKVSENKEVANA
ncbi:MAG: hypothetical protein IPM51_00010 [Sphingobacteriaceae bacterium]|nr:hypothetical protein [Sphingobacteriaceae bacterium]